MSKSPEIPPERYAISYDEKTGKLLETTITNNDYTLVLDSDGKQKSLTLSAQMEAYIAEQEAKARKAAEQQERGGRSSRADGRFAPKGAKLISRTELIEGAKKAKSDVKNGEQKVLINGRTAIIKTKLVDAKNALDKSAVRRITEVYEITAADGKVHRIRETRRVDADGNLLSRQLVDNFKLDRKTRARIVTTFDADNHLLKLSEKYTTKIKGGYHIVKFLSTKFDDSGNPLDRRKTADKIVKTGFFNSTFGQILGIALVVLAAVVAPYALAAYLGTTVAALALTTSGLFTLALAAGAGAAIAQFGVSLAQGQSLKNALISAAITFAATAIGAYFGPGIAGFLGKIPVLGNVLNSVGSALSSVGRGLSGAFGAAATKTVEQTIFQKFVTQFALRVGSEVFSETFGRKLGVFGTVLVLSVAATLGGSLISSAVGSPLSATDFANNFANSIFSGSIQGGVAEALKNERGLGAQFLNQLGSDLASNVSLTEIGRTFYNVSKLQNRPEGTSPIYDLSGKISGFRSEVNGIGLDYDANGKFLGPKVPAGAKVTDLAALSQGKIVATAVENNGNLTLIDPRTGTAVSAPTPAQVASTIDNYIGSLRSSVHNHGSAVASVIENEIAPTVNRITKLIGDDLTYYRGHEFYVNFKEQMDYKLDSLKGFGGGKFGFSGTTGAMVLSDNPAGWVALAGATSLLSGMVIRSAVDAFQASGGFSELFGSSDIIDPRQVIGTRTLINDGGINKGITFPDQTILGVIRGAPPNYGTKDMGGPMPGPFTERLENERNRKPYDPAPEPPNKFDNESFKKLGTAITVGYFVGKIAYEYLDAYGFFDSSSEEDNQKIREIYEKRNKRPIETIPTEIHSINDRRKYDFKW